MDIYSIVVQNDILSLKDLDPSIIQKLLTEQRKKGETDKYIFNVFYEISAYGKFQTKTLDELYLYAKKNIELFLNVSDPGVYSEKDLNNFSLFFALNNYDFNPNNYQDGLNFIDQNYEDYAADKEITIWFQEKLLFFKIYLYSLNLENYKNGTISSLLETSEEIIKNHKENLIYEITDSSIN